MGDTEKRDKSGKFVKGHNLGGRKPIPIEIKEALLGLVPEAIARLESMLLGTTDERLLHDCINTVLNRVYGKPKQEIESINTNINKYAEMTTEEAEKIIQKYENRVNCNKMELDSKTKQMEVNESL